MKTISRQTLVVAAGIGFGLVVGLLVAAPPPATQKQQDSPGVISAPIPAPKPALTTRSNWNFGTTGFTGVFVPRIALSNQVTADQLGVLRQQLDLSITQRLATPKGFTRNSTNEFLYDKLRPRDGIPPMLPPRDGFAPRSRGNTDLIDFRASPPDLRR